MRISDVHGTLESLVGRVETTGGRTLMLFPGRAPSMRLSTGQVEPMNDLPPLHFRDTERLVQSLAGENKLAELDQMGETEIATTLDDERAVRVVIFSAGAPTIWLFIFNRWLDYSAHWARRPMVRRRIPPNKIVIANRT